ncbi:hypothetical protein Lesp01_73210 [Lentzea sp. NBRC 102530]|nr:hypothetical protein Lesp01_73210 [Lentzea sp. NBRC 102530]
MAVELTALGAGISVAGKIQPVLIALAVVNSVLWLRYVDHVVAIFRAAAYVSFVLRPRLSGIVGEPVLRWEAFLRQIRSRRYVAGSAAEIPAGVTQERFPERILGLSHPSLLFGLASPVLVACYLYVCLSSGNRDLFGVWFASVGALGFWAFTVVRHLDTARWIRRVDLLMAEAAADAE